MKLTRSQLRSMILKEVGERELTPAEYDSRIGMTEQCLSDFVDATETLEAISRDLRDAARSKRRGDATATHMRNLADLCNEMLKVYKTKANMVTDIQDHLFDMG